MCLRPTTRCLPRRAWCRPPTMRHRAASWPPLPPGMGGYSAPSTTYDVPGSNDRTVMTYAAPLQSAELTPASTFTTTFSSTTNEVPFMKYAAPMDPLHSYGSPVSSFQPPATPEPISTGAFLATHPELATLDGTARALSTPEPLAGYSTPLATTPARCSETPTTLVGATPLIPGFVADAYTIFPEMVICLTIFFSLILGDSSFFQLIIQFCLEQAAFFYFLCRSFSISPLVNPPNMWESTGTIPPFFPPTS